MPRRNILLSQLPHRMAAPHQTLLLMKLTIYTAELHFENILYHSITF